MRQAILENGPCLSLELFDWFGPGPWRIICVVVALESAGVSLPGETILVAAALLAAATNQIDIAVVVAPAAAGAIAVSIGVAQWTLDIGPYPDRLIAAADHALYAAKKEGKNRYAAYDPAPPLVPDSVILRTPDFRKQASNQ